MPDTWLVSRFSCQPQAGNRHLRNHLLSNLGYLYRHSHPPLISRTGDELRRGLRASLPVMVGFVPFALVLGAQASQKGLSAAEVPLLTGLNFGGGSKFAAIGLWTSPPQVLRLVAVTLLVNSRHPLMGAALAPHLLHWPKRRALPALFFMCDESWAMGACGCVLLAEEGTCRTRRCPRGRTLFKEHP